MLDGSALRTVSNETLDRPKRKVNSDDVKLEACKVSDDFLSCFMEGFLAYVLG